MSNFVKQFDHIIEQARSHAMTFIPAAPEHDLGPEVRIGPTAMDLDGFLALAQQHGGNLLYGELERFSAEQEGADTAVSPDLAIREGQPVRVTAAFVANGVIHFWEELAPWYKQLQDTAPTPGLTPWRRPESNEPEVDDEEQAKKRAEHADHLLTLPEFRAARGRGAKSRYARSVELDGSTLDWYAIDDALDRADQLVAAHEARLRNELDTLAGQLITHRGFLEAQSAGGRKQVAGEFLQTCADGFYVAPWLRDELHHKAQALLKRSRQPTIL